MSSWSVLATALTVALTGCAGSSTIAGLEGADWRIRSHYERYAWEENATCLAPRMRITGWRVVDQTPERTIVDVRYHYNDSRFGDPDDNLFGARVIGRCNGFSQRQFTLVPGAGGGVTVAAMTGPQRQPQ